MLTVDGRVIKVTHPDKLLFPDDGITKGDLVDYYRRIAERMLPYVRGRPIHMNRFPTGIGRAPIVQKRIPESFPAWITRATVDLHRGGVITHAVIDNAATLAYLGNYNMVSLHVWQSRIQAPEKPDQVVFDLDPASDDFSLVRSTARALKSLLDEIGLSPFVKTTGSRGLTPKSNDSSSRPPTPAAASPTRMPATATTPPCRTIMRAMSAGSAPSARRMPISPVRSVTR